MSQNRRCLSNFSEEEQTRREMNEIQSFTFCFILLPDCHNPKIILIFYIRDLMECVMLFPRKRNSKRKTYSINVPSELSADGLLFQERFKKRKERFQLKT